ncbi:MAG: hypothetical protein KF764_05730 [Labilithrix sp.]|nr:hypothetical protein [Labilithrix sp.]
MYGRLQAHRPLPDELLRRRSVPAARMRLRVAWRHLSVIRSMVSYCCRIWHFAPQALPTQWRDHGIIPRVTPREADVVFVLESVAGVRAVYAVSGSPGELEFAVEVDHGTRHVAAAHYALLRVLRRDESRRVLFFETFLPPMLAARVRRLTPSEEEREAARTRVPTTTPELTEEAPPHAIRATRDVSVLIVGSDSELYATAVTAFGVAARRVIEPGPLAAIPTALRESFDVILCTAPVAFGPERFLYDLRARNALVASRVVIVAKEEEAAHTLQELDALGCFDNCLVSPIDPELLREVVRTGCVVLRFAIPVPPARAAPRSGAAVRRRVVVVDDDVTARLIASSSVDDSLEIVVADNAWDALDAIATRPPALVLCSSSLRAGTTLVYRLLWDAHPELKARFLLIVPPGAAAPDRGSQTAVERPVSVAAIDAALSSLDHS